MMFESKLYDFFYEDVVALDKGNATAETGVIFFAAGNYVKMPKETVLLFADDWKNIIGESGLFMTDRFMIAYKDITGFDRSGELPFPHIIFLEGGGFIRLTPENGDELNGRWKQFHKQCE